MKIYHLCVKSEWDSAVSVGEYTRSTRDKTLTEVGFIHCSTADQLQRTAKKFYSDCVEELVLLEIDIKALEATQIEVKFEDGGDGDLFPHIYGPIPCLLVTSVLPAAFNSSGDLEF